MSNTNFRCNVCNKNFKVPAFYYEKHGLDTPPYEEVAICPICMASDFCEFETQTEKIDIAEELLNVVVSLNKYINSLKCVFGNRFENKDFSDGYERIIEIICDMFTFMNVEKQRELFKISGENDAEKFLLYLRG